MQMEMPKGLSQVKDKAREAVYPAEAVSTIAAPYGNALLDLP